MKFDESPTPRPAIDPRLYDDTRHQLRIMRVHLQHVIILLNKKELTPLERQTLDRAMETADISQESVNRIIANEIPWPR